MVGVGGQERGGGRKRLYAGLSGSRPRASVERGVERGMHSSRRGISQVRRTSMWRLRVP